MLVIVCPKKQIHLMDGPRNAGEVVEIPDKLALRYLQQGAVERFLPEVPDSPFPVAGGAALSSASPAVQASAQKIAKKSGDGAKPKRRLTRGE